jgi:hypothetical protein
MCKRYNRHPDPVQDLYRYFWGKLESRRPSSKGMEARSGEVARLFHLDPSRESLDYQ